MIKHVNSKDLFLNFDPQGPQERFRAAGIEGASLAASDLLPDPVPWPKNTAPIPSPLPVTPGEDEDMTKFHGYDAVIMTWTVAEAATLSTLMSPGYTLPQWYQYRHNVEDYIPLVTGKTAPFNDAESKMYYHSLGLYFPCTIGNAKVLLIKSGLHLDDDGPKIPVSKLIAEIVSTVSPKVFITTGTGGGIGSDVSLGDVVIAGMTRFDCTTQFKKEPWSSASFPTSPLPSGVLAAITPALTKVNAARVKGGRSVPKIFSAAQDAIVTTDFFGFDDSTDYYKLQGLGRVCDMGDAMVGQVMQQFPGVKWYAIRNASDPQIPNPGNNVRQAENEAGQIYAKYGALTTAASVIASWAVIVTSFP
jgi:nucleoside phosphorylase